MTRIFTEGAEFNDLIFWNTTSSMLISGTKRSGNYSYHFADYGRYVTKAISSLSEFYIRFAVYTSGFDTGSYSIFRWYKDTTNLGDIRINGQYAIVQAAVNNVVVASGSSTFTTSNWHLIEVHVIIADSGSIQVKYDGILEINYSGDTKPGSDTYTNILYFYGLNWNLLVDDIALNDTNGSTDNSWCGDGRIILLTPSGSGTTNSWVNSGNVSGSANYLYVDEFPYDSDTTYVYASGSSTGDKDKYAMSSFSKPTGSTIKRIFSQSTMRKANTLDTYVKIGYLPLGSTDQLSGSVALTTSYTRITGTSASANPLTGVEWTESDINDLEYVCEITS